MNKRQTENSQKTRTINTFKSMKRCPSSLPQSSQDTLLRGWRQSEMAHLSLTPTSPSLSFSCFLTSMGFCPSCSLQLECSFFSLRKVQILPQLLPLIHLRAINSSDKNWATPIASAVPSDGPQIHICSPRPPSIPWISHLVPNCSLNQHIPQLGRPTCISNVTHPKTNAWSCPTPGPSGEFPMSVDDAIVPAAQAHNPGVSQDSSLLFKSCIWSLGKAWHLYLQNQSKIASLLTPPPFYHLSLILSHHFWTPAVAFPLVSLLPSFPLVCSLSTQSNQLVYAKI